MENWEKQDFAAKKYDEVFDRVCILSDRYCEEKDIVPPTPEDIVAFDRYSDYLNNVTANALWSIIDTYENAGMSYEEACKNFDIRTLDEFIDLDSAQF